MAVNLINSSDIEVEQTGQDIQLKTSIPISTIEGNIGDLTLLNTTNKTSLVNAINTLVATELYYDASGTTDAVNLNDAIENYKFYEITYSRGGSVISSIRMSTKFLQNIELTQILYLNSITRIYTQPITLSGTSITKSTGRYVNIPDSGSINTGTDSFTIYQVLGYK